MAWLLLIPRSVLPLPINIESYDWLVIFDGNNTDGNVLFDSDNSTNIDVVSTTGPLTIYFESDGSVSYSGFEIQVSCESGQTPLEPCNAPTNVTVGNVTANSADVDWTQEGTPDSWTVSYKKGSVNTWTTATTTTRPYTIETSIWTAPYQFTTGCGMYNIPFMEDFDAQQIPPTQCWELASGYLDTVSTLTSSTYGWSNSSTEIISGNGACVYINIYGTSRDNWLISPTIDLGDGSSQYQVEFDTKLTN